MVLEDQVHVDGGRDEGEPQRAQRGQVRVERLDLLEPGEGRTDRDGKLLVVGGKLLAEDGALLVAPAHWLAKPERGKGQDARRKGQDDETPAPSTCATGDRGDATGEQWTDQQSHWLCRPVDAVDAVAAFDRVGVRQQGAVHGLLVGLADPDQNAGDHQLPYRDRKACHDRERRPQCAADSNDGCATRPVTEIAERYGRSEEQQAADGADHAERQVAEVQAVLDVRPQHGEGAVVERIDENERRGHPHHGLPAGGQHLP